MAPSVAIQIVNYRTRAFLEACVASVVRDLAAGPLEYEINILDNASGDELGELAARTPNCRVVMGSENVGFGAGHNRLASVTEARHLFILNPDTELASAATVRSLVGALERDPRAAAAGPRLLDAERRPQRFDHGRLHGWRAWISNSGGHSYWRETSHRSEVAWVSGAALLVERSAFAAIGGFDENLFLYKDEEDLCLRLRQAGRTVVYEPSVAVLHHGSVVARRDEELGRAESYFIEKHFARRRGRRVFAAIHRLLPYLSR